MSTKEIPFGYRHGKLLAPTDLNANENGSSCNCTCPNCGKSLVAIINSQHLRPHFKHKVNQVHCHFNYEQFFLKYIFQLLKEHHSDDLVKEIDENNNTFMIVYEHTNYHVKLSFIHPNMVYGNIIYLNLATLLNSFKNNLDQEYILKSLFQDSKQIIQEKCIPKKITKNLDCQKLSQQPLRVCPKCGQNIYRYVNNVSMAKYLDCENPNCDFTVADLMK